MFDYKLAEELAVDIDQALAKDLHIKQIEFETHEYIKITSVQQIVSTAMSSLMDKINQKEKIVLANKAILRQQDLKLKNLDMQLNQLLKLKKQVENQHKQIKLSQSDIEVLQQN